MLFREHRGLLEESMKTCVPLANSKEALAKYIGEMDMFLDNREVTKEMLTVKPYGIDERNSWDTHIVELSGYGVVGFTNTGVMV